MKSTAASGFWSSVPSLVLISLALRGGVSRGRSGRGTGQRAQPLPCTLADPGTTAGEAQSSAVNDWRTNSPLLRHFKLGAQNQWQLLMVLSALSPSVAGIIASGAGLLL